MKIILFILVIQINSSFLHSKNDPIISMIESGNYTKAIDELKMSAKFDSLHCNWNKWISKQQLIGECYVILNDFYGLNKTKCDIFIIIKKHAIKAPNFLGIYHELNSKVFFFKEDMGEVFIQLQKSYYYKSKLNSQKELLTIYKSLLACANYKRDLVKSAYYRSKLLSIIQQNQIEKYKLVDVYNQISYSIKIQKSNSLEEFNFLYNRSLIYSLKALKLAEKNPILKAITLFYIVESYTRMLDVYFENGVAINNKELIKNGNYKLDESIYLYKNNCKSCYLFIAKAYYVKALLNKRNNHQLAIELYDKSLEILIPNWNKISKTSNYKIDYSSVINKPNAINVLYCKTEKLYQLYLKTSNYNYLKESFKNINIASEICEKMLIEYKTSSPFQILNGHKSKPFQIAIKLAYLLYEKTKSAFYKNKILEFAEYNKYSEVLKSYLTSSSKNRTKNIFQKKLEMKQFSLKEIQKKLHSNNECVIEFTYDSDTSLYCFIITKNNTHLVKYNLNSYQLDLKIIELKNAIEKSNFDLYEKNASLIYKLLFVPLSKYIHSNINQLTIVPEKLLSFIPYEALITAPINISKDYRKLNYLLYKYDISQQLSLTLTLFSKSNETKINSFDFLGIATGKIKGMNELPFSIKSIELLEDAYNGHFLYKKDATKKRFLKYAPSASIIFISSHANSDLINSEHSKIYFNSLRKKESYISLEDVYKLNLNSELVILSACETSLGQYQNAEGILSFERAFTFAGSKSVLSTIWQTDDKANFQILSSFIENLDKKEERFKALILSKRNFISSAQSSEDANPLYWAGFKLIGLKSTIDINKPFLNYTTKISLSFVFIISVLFLLYRFKRKRNK